MPMTMTCPSTQHPKQISQPKADAIESEFF